MGKGLLDKVFSGQKGVAKLLANSLGGTATLVKVGDSFYDEETDDLIQETVDFTVDVVPEKQSRSLQSMVDGVVVQTGDKVLTIPAVDVPIEIVPGKDLIRRDGKTYLIVAVDRIDSGNETALYTILARTQ